MGERKRNSVFNLEAKVHATKQIVDHEFIFLVRVQIADAVVKKNQDSLHQGVFSHQNGLIGLNKEIGG